MSEELEEVEVVPDRVECGCRHPECEGYKYMRENPYVVELFDDHTEYLMCGGDAYEAMMDI